MEQRDREGAAELQDRRGIPTTVVCEEAPARRRSTEHHPRRVHIPVEQGSDLDGTGNH
jgi:hypothetical protein